MFGLAALQCSTGCIGAVIGGLNQRRGTIIDSDIRDDEFTCIAEVALNDMFGYSNQLRGSTQGKGNRRLCVPQNPFSLIMEVNSQWSTRYLSFFVLGPVFI